MQLGSWTDVKNLKLVLIKTRLDYLAPWATGIRKGEGTAAALWALGYHGEPDACFEIANQQEWIGCGELVDVTEYCLPRC